MASDRDGSRLRTADCARRIVPPFGCIIVMRATGAALTGSAPTTLGAFVVLSFSGLPPVRSLGLLGAIGIAFALLVAVLAEPGALVLGAGHRDRPAEGTRERPG